MGRYAGGTATTKVPEAVDGQLTAEVAVSIRGVFTPSGMGERSIELRTQDRREENYAAQSGTRHWASSARAATAAISVAVKRQANPETDIMLLYPARLSAQSVNNTGISLTLISWMSFAQFPYQSRCLSAMPNDEWIT